MVGGRAAIQHAIPDQGTNPRVVAWAALGGYLRTHYPHQLVATVPIGAIGYYSGLPILDLVGLTEPEIAHAGRSVPREQLTKLWIEVAARLGAPVVRVFAGPQQPQTARAIRLRAYERSGAWSAISPTMA